jgi:hypothetical protein
MSVTGIVINIRLKKILNNLKKSIKLENTIYFKTY